MSSPSHALHLQIWQWVKTHNFGTLVDPGSNEQMFSFSGHVNLQIGRSGLRRKHPKSTDCRSIRSMLRTGSHRTRHTASAFAQVLPLHE